MKEYFLHVSHRVSELQGQNPGDVVAFCFRLCLEVWWIFLIFFKRKDRTTKASKSSIRHQLQPNTTKHSQTTKKITHNP